ncbi:MAG: hypothetical protein PQJ59_05060 [Spirochaetales bacterium]|nr:hypothetical protein [Spirochaetales bacterium]
MKRRALFFAIFLLFTHALFAQYDPKIDWKYIETDYNRVIFPDFMADEGLRVAQFTEENDPTISETMSSKHPYRYPIILSGNDMTSNGYVTVFPRRTVWYSLNGGYGSGTTEWYEHLAIHEGRHTKQFDTLNSSTAHLLFLLGGEYLYSLSIGVTPSWMFEGDAIMTETIYSHSGRGRLGSYFELMRSVALEERDYSYYKMHHLSFRDMTPPPHRLGYPFLNWMEENYGPDGAEQLFSQQAVLPLPLLGPSRSVKKLTGLTPARAYKEMIEDLKTETEEILAAKGPLVEGELISPPRDVYTAYSQLLPGKGGTWYAQKVDLIEPTSLYSFIKGEETKYYEAVPATRIDGKGDIFVWDSVRTSLTWTTREESDLYLKRGNNKAQKLTQKGRYYHPALSPQADKIVALELQPDRKPRLVILDLSGQVINEIPFPQEISYASWPAWDGDGIVLNVQNNEGESLWRWSEKGFERVIPFTTEDLSYPIPWEGGYFLTLDRYEGKEICYFKEGKLIRVTNTPLGADYPAVDREGGRLLYVYREGTIGDSVRALPLSPETWDGRSLELLPAPIQPETTAPTSSKDYEIKDYPGLDLFSPVGWGLSTLEYDSDEDLEIPIAIKSTNPLQSFSWEGGLYYNTNEETMGYGLETEWSLFLPHVTTDLSLDKRVRNGVTIRDFTAGAGLSLPLGFSRGRDTFSLELSAESVYLYSWTDYASADGAGFLEELEMYHSRDGGYRALQSRFKEYLSASLLHYNTGDDDYQFSLANYYLLPGIFPSHGTGFYGYYEQNPSGYSSNIPQVRGSEYDDDEESLMLEEQIMFKAEYVLPLFYPDCDLGGLAYIPRVSTELFLDRQWYGDGWDETVTSAGAELLVDTFFFTLPVMIRSGLQLSHQFETGDWGMSFVIKGYTVSY